MVPPFSELKICIQGPSLKVDRVPSPPSTFPTPLLKDNIYLLEVSSAPGLICEALCLILKLGITRQGKSWGESLWDAQGSNTTHHLPSPPPPGRHPHTLEHSHSGACQARA